MSVVPSTWVQADLPDAVFFQEGPGLRKFQYREAGIPFLNIRTFVGGRVDGSLCRFLDPEEVEKKYQHFLVQAEDILVATSGSIGKWAIAKEADLPLMLNTSIVRFRPHSDDMLDRGYLLWFLRSPLFTDQAWAASTGSAQSNVGPTHLKKFHLPLPPLPEQRRIVAKLDRLSARSAAARDHLTRTTQLATRAKQAITRQLIRERQWETAQFLDVCDAYQPKTISKAQMQGDGKYPVFGANGKIGFYDQFNHDHRELLVTCRGATCGAVNISEPFSWINGNAMVIKGKADHFTLDFLRAYFSHGFDFSTVISGSAQPQITRQSLAKLRMPIVPMEEQEEIVRRIEAAFARIDRMTEEASRAAHLLYRLDERLLAKAFRGELVPQDPEDEPAEALLTRIREARAAAPKPKRGRRTKAATE